MEMTVDERRGDQLSARVDGLCGRRCDVRSDIADAGVGDRYIDECPVCQLRVGDQQIKHGLVRALDPLAAKGENVTKIGLLISLMQRLGPVNLQFTDHTCSAVQGRTPLPFLPSDSRWFGRYSVGRHTSRAAKLLDNRRPHRQPRFFGCAAIRK